MPGRGVKGELRFEIVGKGGTGYNRWRFKAKARIQVANLVDGTRPPKPGVRPRKHQGMEVRLKARGI